MSRIKTAFIILSFVFKFQSVICQHLTEKIKTTASIGFRTGNGKLNPFWVRSNQNGMVPLETNNLFTAIRLSKDYDSTFSLNKKLNKTDIGFGLTVVANAGSVNQIQLNEAFFKFRFLNLEAYIGRRREIFGITDSTQSSGALIWSGNATPLPKIQISIPNFTPIFKSKIFFYKATFAHGWFGNQQYVQNYFLHQKTLYGKIGKSNWPINLIGGINNQVHWGGYSDHIKNSPGASQNGYLPSGFNSFLSSAFPLPIIKKTFPPNISLLYDNLNYGGNHLGSLDLATEINLQSLSLLMYRQIPYELGSLFSSLVNADDGIYGLTLKLKKPFYSVNKITIEGLHTYNQGYYRSGIAKLLGLPDKHYGELHRYFNHGQYNDGWSYNGNGIGNPLILSNNQINSEGKISDPQFLFSNYSQTKLLYFAISGNQQKIKYLIKSNYGIYRATNGPYISNNPSIPQFSFFSCLDYPIKNINFNLSFGLDRGSMLENNFGFSFQASKTWF
jgi:hypothetical protein